MTFDASSAGGSTDACKDGLEAAWPRILAAGATADGRGLLQKAFRTCSLPRPKHAMSAAEGGGTVDDAMSIVQWAAGPWANMAMGNYP